MAATTTTETTISQTRTGVLVLSMLVAGCCSSILSKYQDMQKVTPDGKTYEQPVYQTLNMFIGESLCLVALLAARSKRKSGEHRNLEYRKLAIADSGVVLTDTDIIEEQEDSTPESAIEVDGSRGVQAHKSIVGPDEILPGDIVPTAPCPELSGTKAFLMWLPAIFDICGSTLMSVGLLWVPVSVYQMLRGALVLWVGLFSVVFLHRRLPAVQWASLFIVMLGVAIVGLSNSISRSYQEPDQVATGMGRATMGAALILFAQLFTASQFVIEEKIMTRYSLEPLRAVGLEGIFGLLTTLVLMPILYFTFGRSPSGKGGYFDIVDGFHQTIDNRTVWVTSIAIAILIAIFNFSGLAVTKSVSATARSLIDTCRTVGIWAISLALGWEQLAGLQILGFALLVYGTLCFNDVLSFPSFLDFGSKDSRSACPSEFNTIENTSKPHLRYDGSGGRASSGDAQIIVIRHDIPSERTSLI